MGFNTKIEAARTIDSQRTISHSQIECYSKCPERYRRRYIEGEKLPIGERAAVGRVIHTAAAHNFRQKATTGTDLKSADVVDMAMEELKVQCKSDGYLATGNMVGETKRLTNAHIKYQAPDYQPYLIEEHFVMPWDDGIQMEGIIDLVSADCQIVDFKTASKSKTQDEADRSLQLTIYHMFVTSLPAAGLYLDVVLDTIVNTQKVKRQKLVSNRDAIDHDIAYSHVAEVVRAIDAGVFPPTSPTNWWCSIKYCEFAKTCRFFRGDRNGKGND